MSEIALANTSLKKPNHGCSSRRRLAPATPFTSRKWQLTQITSLNINVSILLRVVLLCLHEGLSRRSITPIRYITKIERKWRKSHPHSFSEFGAPSDGTGQRVHMENFVSGPINMFFSNI